MSNEIIARTKTRAEGRKRYYTGKLCPLGHAAERLVSSRSCVACADMRTRKWVKENPARVRDINRKCMGLPLPTRPCPNCCENCNEPPNGSGSLHLDHDHTTGKFRGWLCYRCNGGLGMLGDSIEGLSRALRYLQRAA